MLRFKERSLLTLYRNVHSMPITRRTYIVAALAALMLAVIGALVWYFVFRQETITFNSYVCEDGSFYFVLQDKEAIEILGQRYELVSQEAGERYEGAGPLAFVIAGDLLTVLFRESGQQVAACRLGAVESAPIIQTN